MQIWDALYVCVLFILHIFYDELFWPSVTNTEYEIKLQNSHFPIYHIELKSVRIEDCYIAMWE